MGYFKEVVEQGSKDNIDIWKRAFDAYKLGDYRKAFVNYNFLADLGYEIAQANVAQMIHDKNVYDLSGLFDKKSWKSREKFNWQRAADQTGSTAKQATLQLGDIYYYDEANFEKAIYHYRIAADSHGHPQALYNMGYMYQHGLGLKQDLHLAKRNYDKASEVDSDAAIAVTLTLLKLAFDY